MSDAIYHQLATVLDTLPNGFSKTDSGVEIRLLKKMFEPEEAELFGEMKLKFETADQIAARTKQTKPELETQMDRMWRRGLLFGVDLGGVVDFSSSPEAGTTFSLTVPI